jgi:5'-nucleotidase
MAWSPEDSLVIGISSRALFKLDEEDRIYREQGTEAFIDYQRAHETELIKPGVAFPLVEALLKLNPHFSR